MGRWGRRSSKPEAREKTRASRSSSYSDDYRITPELMLADAHKHAHKLVSDVRGMGSGGEMCCSQDTRFCPEDEGPCCSQDERCYTPDPPRRYSSRQGRSASAGGVGSGRGSFGGLEVVVVDEGHVDLRRQAPCTSCESCDTCQWASESITRIELKNHLFTSPMHSDRKSLPYDSGGRHVSPSPARRRSSAQRHYNTAEGDGRRLVSDGGRQVVVYPRTQRPVTRGRSRHVSDPRLSNTQRSPSIRRTPTVAHGRHSRRDNQRLQQHTDTGQYVKCQDVTISNDTRVGKKTWVSMFL